MEATGRPPRGRASGLLSADTLAPSPPCELWEGPQIYPPPRPRAQGPSIHSSPTPFRLPVLEGDPRPLLPPPSPHPVWATPVTVPWLPAAPLASPQGTLHRTVGHACSNTTPTSEAPVALIQSLNEPVQALCQVPWPHDLAAAHSSLPIAYRE